MARTGPTQIVTNGAALDGFYDIFRINGLAEDGMQVKQLEFYRKVGSTSSVQLVNTNISFPLISAALSSSTELQLKWRSPSFGYVLQSTTNISSPSSWSDLAVTVTQSGSNNVAIVNPNSQTSYRLISR